MDVAVLQACGIFSYQGLNPLSPALANGFFTKEAATPFYIRYLSIHWILGSIESPGTNAPWIPTGYCINILYEKYLK